MANHNLPPPPWRTPLYELTVRQKARFTTFAGWEMPVQYYSVRREHEAVRTTVGMFDISHMGKFTLRGQGVIEALQGLVPSDLGRLQPGKAQYTVLLNPEAGIVDDIIAYYQAGAAGGRQQVKIIVNAATTDKDRNWLSSHLPASIALEDDSRDSVLIAIQGTQAEAALQPHVRENLSKIRAFEHCPATILEQTGFIARTGYTGEDGFEVMLPPVGGQNLWRELSRSGVAPCGLGARDTLRLEAALALYGQDIDERTTPLEAGLGWLVHLKTKTNDFIGRPLLEKQDREGVRRKLVGLEMEGRHIARHGYPVLASGRVVGEVTSGTLSPTLGKAIALAYVPTAFSAVGQPLAVEIRGQTYPARVVKKPFYRSAHR